MSGYEKARGIEPKAKIIVRKLKFKRTNKAKKHRTREYKIPSLIEILPDAIGRFFVRYTFESNSLSKMSFTMHPADLINTDPIKKSIR